jgi:hypothetical protein
MTPTLLHDGSVPAADAHSRAELEIQPNLLIFDPRLERAVGLVQELREGGVRLDATVFHFELDPSFLTRDHVEVAAINLDGAAPEGLVFAAELGAQVPSVQFVFWCDGEKSSPGEEAARSLGVQRIVPRSRLVEWLATALEPLACIARAKREQARAEAALPRIPGARSDRSSAPMPLPEAERSFRESYLRALLAQASNARIAAQQAGVPYTTLCSMLKKMGLERAIRAKTR